MPKNIKGGNKTKKQKRGYQKKEALDSVDSGQMFGQILENRGYHFSVLCTDNVSRLGWLTASAKKGMRIVSNSFVVLSVRDYETNKKNCDIFAVANPPNDVKNIFRKINPLAVGDDNIVYYTQDDKFKEFEESQATITEIVVMNQNNENTSNNEKNSNDWLDDEGTEIYSDPKAHNDNIDWNDI